MKRIYNVFLNETLVGYLTEGDHRRISFRFTADYIRMTARPVLSQSFEDDLYKIYSGKKLETLPPFFANLIPERGRLRDLIEANLPEKDDLSVLEAVGLDLPGAVIVEPGQSDSHDFLSDDDNSVDTLNDLENGDLVLRFSLAGVQLKFSVSREHDKLTLPASGQGGEWIIKLDTKQYPNLVENEYTIMEWARAAGFDVPECSLQPVNILAPELQKFVNPDSKVYVIKRYDRNNRERIHQEDFTQVVSLQPHLKYDHITYEDLAYLILNIVDDDAYYEFIRRLAFMIASGDTDSHLKNWSLLYPNAMRAELSPLYDQVFTLAWKDISTNLALKFAGIKPIFKIDEEAFARLAHRAKADPVKTVRILNESLEIICESWRSLEARSVFPETHLDALNEYWQRAPLLKRYSL